MKSNDRSDLLDLARGLPTAGRDVAALRALRDPPMTDADYMRFLALLAPADRASLAARRGPSGEPFRLP